ncbi:ABC transporter ATP-binding protein [Bdellovibrio bacteriovorus]|uniref:ABC-type dipeptide transport system, ATPase component n=1 Tax=Bdellovibrio bacteriovorus str. Tiberius TaxID=1069642 RepID=K7YW46_BDEBC|nr:ABC transporter ATP-binding protein [Bdellovibrio bacteriovorus]AFY00910.1 ABC-type dipeptide transport system, ATPase component [Bdellovibrio bacteriovorus str. Tiberius]
MSNTNIIEVRNLAVEFKTEDGIVQAVKGISFNIPKGKTVGLVGESGSGKSITSLAIMRLIGNPGRVSSGEILFEGQDLLKVSEKKMREIRGARISMIFQEPMTSLNPVLTVADQITETLMLHQNLNKQQALDKALDLLKQVGIPHAEERLYFYPHKFSGGQRQRIMIAMAIACNPDVLICDEPTTALDVTIQKQILDLLADIQKRTHMSLLFITHDLGVVADIADEVIVMNKGEIVERGVSKEIFDNPKHPYTKGLLACRPSLDENPVRLPVLADFMSATGEEITPVAKVYTPAKEIIREDKVILEVNDLKTHFPHTGGLLGRVQSYTKAVDGVSFKVKKGQTLGLVGESGCGKTTLGRTLMRLIEPTDGQIIFDGQDITKLDYGHMHPIRKKMQIIFQDPYASLNPRMTIGTILMEPMQIHNIGDNNNQRREIAEEMLKKVGMSPAMMNRYPHEFSGGQRQRISIARALMVRPEFIVCDESVSALDVSIQAQILNLLLDLQDEMNLTYIFISHDLSVVKFISDEVAVMFGGKIVEHNTAQAIYDAPQHDYTKKLLSAIPKGIPKELTV